MIKVKTDYGDIKFITRELSKSDKSVIKEIFTENVYHLHDNMFPKNAIVFDIGANIGAFTLNVLLRAKNNGTPVTIYAIEPEPSNLMVLKQNLANNDHLLEKSTVHIIEKAVGGSIGKVKISDEHGDSRISDEGTEIDMTTLDAIFEEYNIENVDFAKFDIEGSEIPTIMAASDETIDKLKRTAIEFDEENGLENFSNIVDRFARKSSMSTLGVPYRGCYIYTERHI